MNKNIQSSMAVPEKKQQLRQMKQVILHLCSFMATDNNKQKLFKKYNWLYQEQLTQNSFQEILQGTKIKELQDKDYIKKIIEIVFPKIQLLITKSKYLEFFQILQEKYKNSEYNHAKEEKLDKKIYQIQYTKVQNPQMKHAQNQKLKEQQQKAEIDKKKEEQLQLKRKIIIQGLKKLQKYMQTHNAIQLFEDCDQDYSDSLNQMQFNKLLIATQIKQFQDKHIRKVLINQVMAYFPNKQMQRKEYLSFFKIKQKKQEQIFYKPPEKIKVPQIPTIKIQIPKQKNSQSQSEPPKESIKEQQETQIEQSNSFLMQYYNPKCSINKLQLQRFFSQLQVKPKPNQQFQDKCNPRTLKGQYKSAKKIFYKGVFRLFELASSVLFRENNRSGIGLFIQAKDIIQGQVGNCYFLSSLSSLAHIYPQFIQNIFIFKDNRENCYGVKFFFNGKWQIVITDNRFPCKQNIPVYSKPHGNQIWVMVIQKCWAKLFKSYQAIQNDKTSQALQALTGALTQVFSLDSEANIQIFEQKLAQAVKNGYLITTIGSKYLQDLSQQQRKKIGLVKNHSYSLLKLCQINGQKLLKLRNPWGKIQWKGDWCYQSEKWTSQLRKEHSYQVHPLDGSFYMPMKDYFKYFQQFVVCKFNPQYVHTNIISECKKHKSKYFKIEIHKKGKYFFSIYQQNRKRKLLKDYRYSPARLAIMKKNKNKNWQYIGSRQQYQNYTCSVQSQFQQGEYILKGQVNWKLTQIQQKICLTSYGPSSVNFEQINKQNINDLAILFEQQLIRSFSQKNKGKGKIRRYNCVDVPQAYHQIYMSLQHGIGYYYFKNPTNKPIQLYFTIQNKIFQEDIEKQDDNKQQKEKKNKRKKNKGIKAINIKPKELNFESQKSQYICKMKEEKQILIGFFVKQLGFKYEYSETINYKNEAVNYSFVQEAHLANQ